MVVAITVRVDMSMGMGEGAAVAASFTLGITECRVIKLRSTKLGLLRGVRWQGREVGRSTRHLAARNIIITPRRTRRRGICRLNSSSWYVEY